MIHIIPIEDCNSKLSGIHSQLVEIEKSVFSYVLSELVRVQPGRDRAKCDPMFSYYTQAYLVPCVSKHLASRVTNVGGDSLIQNVVALEKKMATEFHKGVLFHDTAVAQLVSGNEDGYEYLIAMTDEEEVRTQNGAHKRGTMNLRSDGLAAKTIIERMQFACDLLNGGIAGHAANFSFLTRATPVTPPQFDSWRQKLDALHQFELLRIIHDIEVFVGAGYPDYQPVKDNPFVMLRSAKALSHLAQWVESCLTQWQGTHGGLHGKLNNDPEFSNALRASAGGAKYPGNSPQGAAVDTDLQQLLTDVSAAAAGSPRHWRLLRILYIVRNSTAHTIEPNLAMYANRTLLLNLLQVVFVSVFVISQLKAKRMP